MPPQVDQRGISGSSAFHFYFGDGFDLYTLASDCATQWAAPATTGTNLMTLGGGRFVDSQGVYLNSGAVMAANLGQSSGNQYLAHHISIAVMQPTAIGGTTQGLRISFYQGGSLQNSIGFRSDGTISMLNSAGATIAAFANGITTANTWVRFEFEMLLGTTTGEFTIRKNGNTVNDFHQTGLNNQATANAWADEIRVTTITTGAHAIDDILWRADVWSAANGGNPWVGDIRCYTRLPVADASVSWTRPANFIQPAYSEGGDTTLAITANTAVYVALQSQGGSFNQVRLNLPGAYTGNMKCTVFNSGGGVPGTVLRSADAPLTNLVAGDNVFTFATPVSVPVQTPFWIGFCPSATSGNWNVSAVFNDGNTSTGVTYANFPQSTPPMTGTAVGFLHTTLLVTPSGNFCQVCDAATDFSFSYNSSSVPNSEDLYSIAPLSVTPANTVVVITRGLMMKSDTGTRNAAMAIKSGATPQAGISAPLQTNWSWLYVANELDPNTGGLWTAASVNALQIGAVVY